MTEDEIVDVIVTNVPDDSLRRLLDEMLKHESYWVAAKIRDELARREKVPFKP